MWSNSHFRREAFAAFSQRLIHSTVTDASQSAAAGVDTRAGNSIFDSASQTPPLAEYQTIASIFTRFLADVSELFRSFDKSPLAKLAFFLGC